MVKSPTVFSREHAVLNFVEVRIRRQVSAIRKAYELAAGIRTGHLPLSLEGVAEKRKDLRAVDGSMQLVHAKPGSVRNWILQ